MRRAFLFVLTAFLVSGCSLLFPFEDCNTDSDCTLGQVCSSGICSKNTGSNLLLTPPCQKIYGVSELEAKSDNVYLLASILPYTGELATYGPDIDKAIELAVEQINQSGGVLGTKIGVISCDSATDASVAIKAAQNLVDTGRIAGIIGAAASSITIEIFNAVAHDAGVLVMSPAATSTAITNVVDDDLLWRTPPSDAGQGAAIAALARSQNHSTLAVVNRNDTYGNALEKEIRTAWCATVPAESNCSNSYLSRSYGNNSDPKAGQTSTLTDITNFEPDVVVLVAFEEDGVAFLKLADNTNLKHFILSDGIKSTTVLNEITNNELLCNIIGTNAADPSGDTYNSFALDFEKRWGTTPGAYTAHAYDAGYLMAYAIAAAAKPPEELTGADLSAGLKRLSSGNNVNVGNFAYNGVPQTLWNNPAATIDFAGASGALDFDNSTGEADSSVEGWYFDLSTKSIKSAGVIYDENGTFIDPTLPNNDKGGSPTCGE